MREITIEFSLDVRLEEIDMQRVLRFLAHVFWCFFCKWFLHVLTSIARKSKFAKVKLLDIVLTVLVCVVMLFAALVKVM